MLLSLCSSQLLMPVNFTSSQTESSRAYQSFWLTCFLSPLFFCSPPLRSSGWEHWSLAWIFTACLLDLLMYGFGHWASYGLSLHFGDSTLCISVFQFKLLSRLCCWKIMTKYFVVTWLWFWNAKFYPLLYYSVLLICSVLWYLHACLPCLTPLQS